MRTTTTTRLSTQKQTKRASRSSTRPLTGSKGHALRSAAAAEKRERETRRRRTTILSSSSSSSSSEVKVVAVEEEEKDNANVVAAKPSGRRVTAIALAGLASGFTQLGGLSSSPSSALAAQEVVEEEKAFLRKSLGNGLLAEEEERLIKLRMTSEANAKRLDAQFKQELEQVINRARAEGEAEAKKNFEKGNALCATPFGVDIVGITEGIALLGALVGGLAAKSRRDEVQKLNEQLRTINVTLRKQARSGIVYAPDMNYAPPLDVVTVAETSQQTTTAEAATQTEAEEVKAESTSASSEEEADPSRNNVAVNSSVVREESEATISMKKGRRLLEQKKGAAALVQFEKARMLSRSDGNKTQERRAERGLAAASGMQKQYKKALGHLERVLEISKEIDDFTGDNDAYGVMADIYTELGDFEKAAKFYDLYINSMI